MVEIRSFNIKLNTTLIGSRIVPSIRCYVVKLFFLTIKLSVFQSIRSRFYCGSLYVVLNIFIVSSYTVLSVLYYIIFCRRSSNLPYIIFYFYHLAIPILFKTVYNYSFHETIINFLLTIVDGNRRPGGQESQVVSRVINQHETLSIHRLVSQQECQVVNRLRSQQESLVVSRLVNQRESLAVSRPANQQDGLVVSRLETSTEGLSISRLVKIQIMLVTLTGRTIAIDVESSADRISRLKQLIFEREGVPPAQQRLVSSGKQLEEQFVTQGSAIHLLLSIRGGRPRKKKYLNAPNLQDYMSFVVKEFNILRPPPTRLPWSWPVWSDPNRCPGS